MALEAGLYEIMWRPERFFIEKAEELIEGLKVGLKNLQSDPDRFKQFNPKNAWGSYDNFVLVVSKYLSACMEYPYAIIEVDR